MILPRPAIASRRRQRGGLSFVVGLLLVVLGGGLILAFHHGEAAGEARADWRETTGELRSMAIEYRPQSRSAPYELVVDYEFTASGAPRAGRWIAGKHWGRGPGPAARLAAQIEPSAAALSADDFSARQTRIGWEYRTAVERPAVRVRYDPTAPGRSEMLFPSPLAAEPTVPAAVAWGLGAVFVLPGLVLLAVSRPSAPAAGRAASGDWAHTPTGILPDDRRVHYATSRAFRERDTRAGRLPLLPPVNTPEGSFVEFFERADDPRLADVEVAAMSVYEAVHVACERGVGARFHLARGGHRDLDARRVHELVEHVWFQGK